MISSPSSSFAVMIESGIGFDRVTGVYQFTVYPPGNGGFRRGPISSATSIGLTAWSKWRWLPSGSVITGIYVLICSGAPHERAHTKLYNHNYQVKAQFPLHSAKIGARPERSLPCSRLLITPGVYTSLVRD